MKTSPRRIRTALCVVLISLAGSHVSATLALYTKTASIGANSFTTGSLAAPTGLTATGACNGHLAAKVTLSWNAVTGATAYEVWRATGGGAASQVATPATNSYTDTSAAVNTSYSYTIITERNNWRSASSSAAAATTPTLCP